ncbi:hypothetical protein ACN0IV_03210 [Trabulsiella odontotermitis]|uniref:hypothetical protein n=1 Tax=Trabulsiella odontotermitis TaxID=379893 RepID=UPI003AD195E2
MKSSIKHILLLLRIFFSSYTFLQISICKEEPLYGYGKKFYNNTAHDIEKIYPLESELKYNSNSSSLYDDESQKSENAFVQITIDGNISDNHVIVNISLPNHTDNLLIVPKKNLSFQGRIANPVFSILSECIRLDYLGPYVNFGMEYVYPDDFIIIEPDKTFNDSIYLDEYYHFLPGEHQYEIHMVNIPVSFNPDNATEENDISINSNRIVLKIDGNKIARNIKTGY